MNGGSLEVALDTVARAVAGPVRAEARTDIVAHALRGALAMRRNASTADALVRLFGEVSTRRDHPGAPRSIDDARTKRLDAEGILAHTRADVRMIETRVDPIIAALYAAGLADEAAEVKSARDALLATLHTLAGLADDVIDVMLVYESELSSDANEAPVPVDAVLARFPRVA